MVLQMNEHILSVAGHIHFDNVVEVWKKSLDLLLPFSTVTIDLKELEQSDSSGLALLVGWLRMARTQKKKMIFLNIPSSLKALAKVSGLNGLLSESFTHE